MVFSTAELIKLEYVPKPLKSYIGTCLLFPLPLLVFICMLCWFTFLYALFVSHTDMVHNAEKRRLLAKVALKRKATPDVDASSPVDAPPAPISAPSPFAPAPMDPRQERVVEATASEDENTCSGLIFKRKRGIDVVVPAHSASDDRAPSFKENPPSASSPHDMVVHEGGGESAPRGDSDAPPAAELPAFLQQTLQSFQDQEMMESLGEDPLPGCEAKGLGEFLVMSSLALTKVQEFQTEMQELRAATSRDIL